MNDALAAQDDPFAEADREFDQSGEDPFDDVTQEPVPGRPVVDAEGKPVEDPQSAPSDGGQTAAPDTSAAGEADPPPAESDPGTSEPAEPAAAASPDANGEMDPPQAAAPTDGDQTAPIAEAAELPEERRDKNNKVTHRKYLIFRQVGQEKWEQLSWYEDADGKLVPKGTEGATRRNSCLVRSRDDALAIGYAAMGAPPEGIGLVAVTGGIFAERVVKPAPIQPTRSRLTIS